MTLMNLPMTSEDAPAIQVLADALAAIDGHNLRAETYIYNATELLRRLRAREYVLVPAGSPAPRKWACGWIEETGRCVRLGCRKRGPCDGYTGT